MFVLTFLPALVVFTLVIFGSIQLDLALHPRVMNLIGEDWHWYHYFISYHGATVAYMKSWLWLIYPYIAALIFTLGAMWRSNRS